MEFVSILFPTYITGNKTIDWTLTSTPILAEKCTSIKVENLASRGGLLFRQAGSPEAAAQLLVRTAKLLEITLPKNAIGLYQKVCARLFIKEIPRLQIDPIRGSHDRS